MAKYYVETNENQELIPSWIIRNLDQFGNCLVSKDRVKKCQKISSIEIMVYERYGIKCKLRIYTENQCLETTKVLPEHANYILEIIK